MKILCSFVTAVTFAALTFIVLTFSVKVSASEPSLSIKSPSGVKSFKMSELLKSKHLTKITIEKDPAYPGVKMSYLAVPAKTLFEKIKMPEYATVQFNCTDGFSAPLNRERLIPSSKDASIPYIAIEDPKAKWPNLKGKAVSAGPFYLVWMNPENSKVSQEEWPFMLAGFEVKPSLKAHYPEIFPDASLAATHPAQRGVDLFTKNCFACHTMNGKGSSAMGPDLNLPMSPTEYLADGMLFKLIRNPRSLRHWPQSKMNAFPKEVLSDQDVNDIVAYLGHMAKRKHVPLETATLHQAPIK